MKLSYRREMKCHTFSTVKNCALAVFEQSNSGDSEENTNLFPSLFYKNT